MDRPLNFYEVSSEYILYLLRFDSKVPKVDYSAEGRHERFLCGIVLAVGGYDYFAPISSYATQQRTNMIIKNERGKAISSIRFSFMIPMSPGVYSEKKIQDESSPEYRRLLDWELKYCRSNANTIYRMAKFIYNAVVEKKDPLMIKNCCNFKILEAACAEYAKVRINIETPGSRPFQKKSLLDQLAKAQTEVGKQNPSRQKPHRGKNDLEL